MSLSFSIIPGRIISRWESHGAAGGPACYFRCLWKHQLGRLLGNQMIKRKVNGRAIDNECIMKVYMKLGSKHPYACMDKRPWIPLSNAMVIVKQTWWLLIFWKYILLLCWTLEAILAKFGTSNWVLSRHDLFLSKDKPQFHTKPLFQKISVECTKFTIFVLIALISFKCPKNCPKIVSL